MYGVRWRPVKNLTLTSRVLGLGIEAQVLVNITANSMRGYYNGCCYWWCVCLAVALDPFPTVIDPQVHRPAVGSSLTLRCDPPASYPPGTVYWGTETKGGPKLRPIENTDRVSLDYEGTVPTCTSTWHSSRNCRSCALNDLQFCCKLKQLQYNNFTQFFYVNSKHLIYHCPGEPGLAGCPLES